jgi:hypothetical protein
MADLVVHDFAFARYLQNASSGTSFLCLNQDSHGDSNAKNLLVKPDPLWIP